MGIIAAMLSPFFVQAQTQMPSPVTFTVAEAPEQVAAGEVFEITIEAEIEGKWHLYSVDNDPDAGPYPTTFSLPGENAKIAGEVEESDPVIEFDPNFEVELGWHTEKATFKVPVAFLKGSSGKTKAGFEILYQVCDDKVCLPPATEKISRSVMVSGIADEPVVGFDAPSEAAGASDAVKEENPAEEYSEKSQLSAVTPGSVGGDGIFSFLWLAITAGFAALITPCVYPMIPLTVSYFTKKGEGSKRRSAGAALGFGVAIIAVFTILGVLLALFVGAAGANRFAANPWVNLSIAVILVVFALSLLGAFEIRLPYTLTNWLNQKSSESTGFAGILFMALTISAVSFSCTAPFVGGVLAATTGGQWFYPIIGMIGFSAAFASPFVLLALFPGWMESLPKSGSWMNIAKVLLGFIELAAAFKFLSNADLVWEWGLVSRPFTVAAWIAISLLAGLYVLGVFAMRHESKPKTIGTGRLLLSMPFLLFSFYLIPGLLGASLGIWDAWLPPKQATDISIVSSISQTGASAASAENWSDDYRASLERAAESQKPVFIDFTGYTCTNCRAMESNVFPLASVQQAFEKMELVRLYTDDGAEGPAHQKFQFELTGTVALPTYVIINPNTEEVINQLEGYSKKEVFQKFLKQGLTIFNQQDATI